MLSMTVQGAKVEFTYKGDGLIPLIKDLAIGIHAAASEAEKHLGGPAAKKAVRAAILALLTDESTWSLQPDRMERITEVDTPEELFDQGEG